MLIKKAGVRLLENNAIHVKVPGAALQNPRTLKPIIAVEVGFSKTLVEFYDDARYSLRGSHGNTCSFPH